MSSAPAPVQRVVSEENEFTSERHVYEPHKIGIPPLRPYVRELWRRREFAREMARTNLRTQHFNTVFGQLWLVLNPLLLACVYFLLVYILRGSGSRGTDFFAHLLAGLFAYYFVSDSIRLSVKSVTGGGRLILNTAFPRALLPLSSVITAFMRFLPTLLIYVPVHIVAGLPVNQNLLWVFPLIFLMFVMAAGAGMLVSALQVYFRDVKNFLPYFLRIWLYSSPVLYYAHEVPEGLKWILVVNPLGGVLTAWSDVLIAGATPELWSMALAVAWSFGIFIAGGLFFVSREREFAVRL
ncbi:MAG TPA: ABC transporter permease [Solirubrobacteraceae bacterium]|nr:ABC transporter permease [Solirubrobacteraceae bacterium]